MKHVLPASRGIFHLCSIWGQILVSPSFEGFGEDPYLAS
jgi:hypothetical protein